MTFCCLTDHEVLRSFRVCFLVQVSQFIFSVFLSFTYTRERAENFA